MKSKLVWIELDSTTGLAVRIFRSKKEALSSGVVVQQEDKASATKQIRRAVFVRDNFYCVHCGKYVTWSSGHMHERKAKGKGGLVSLENSETRCYACHIGNEDSSHGSRRPRFTNRPKFSSND